MLCRFWQKGNCRYGDQCRYEHSNGVGAAAAGAPPHRGDSAQTVCVYFAAGSCRYGEACHNLHVLNGGPNGVKGKGKGKGKAGRGKAGGGKGGDDAFKGDSRGGQGQGKGLYKNMTLVNEKGPSCGGDSVNVQATRENKALTGPYLGKGSQLQKLWSMPEDEGHDDGIAAATLMGDRLCTGGVDQKLLLWRGDSAAGGGICLKLDNEMLFPSAVLSLLFHAESKWFFCGLLDGHIKAYCQEPAAEASLDGHTAAVTVLLIHEGVLLSGSEDCTIRAWRRDGSTGSFQCAATIQSPVGPAYSFHVSTQAGSLWVGAQQGVSCISLQSLQCVGSIHSTAQVVGLLPYEDCIIACYADGVAKVLDATGNEKFSHGPVGEHTTNTAVALMRHPHAGKTLLLCGQELGYVTAYDLPEFRPRGTFATGYQGDVTAIVDMGADGLFVTTSFSGDVVIWRWGG
eukprot:CAMPEP_0117509340 /NCGR_PEP_ID=MMETSP0784-20121206/27423_1 /TAXON_ID=39447 /ORGANISM="" /LENGTH=454 /DNA_ID=CAMNT_0005304941 /DNA_START=1 /DNA_END=1361 /DNA_ORIENTATION=-